MTGEGTGVVIEDGHMVTTVTLDRPKSLNALTTDMVRRIKDCVEASAKPVLIRSAHPSVFCAGGDIRAIRSHSLAGERSAVTDFFATEYAMNLAIAQAVPPVVSVVDGVCLGGGLGIAGHSGIHVVTDRAAIAMPESAIGFFPDVGASHLLAGAPGAIGLYLGMTGARVGADDAVYSGLATHIVSAERVAAFEQRVQQVGLQDALQACHRPVQLDSCTLHAHRADIDRCFSADTVAEIIDRVADSQNDWSRQTLGLLTAAAPQSLVTAFTAIRLARGTTLADCLATDLRIAEGMVTTPDFLEGVGAKLVDKRAAVWTSRLDDPAPVPAAGARR